MRWEDVSHSFPHNWSICSHPWYPQRLVGSRAGRGCSSPQMLESHSCPAQTVQFCKFTENNLPTVGPHASNSCCSRVQGDRSWNSHCWGHLSWVLELEGGWARMGTQFWVLRNPLRGQLPGDELGRGKKREWRKMEASSELGQLVPLPQGLSISWS